MALAKKHSFPVADMKRRRLPPLNPLRAFEVAARNGSFTLAAKELNLTQSAISRQVGALERYLGVSLFRRESGRLEPTELAERYLPILSQAFDSMNSATESLFGSKDHSRLFIKSSLRTFSMTWLMPRLSSYRALHPDNEITLNTSTRIRAEDFDEEPIDIAVTRDPPHRPGLKREMLMDEYLTVVCNPGRKVDDVEITQPSDLARCTLLNNSVRPECWNIWFDKTEIDGVNRGEGPSLDGFSIVIQAAIAGIGVAVLPKPVAEQSIELGLLFEPFNFQVSSGGSYYLLYPEHRGSREKVRAFKEWLLAEAGVLAGSTRSLAQERE